MSRFLHTSMRLNSDLRKAYRLFTLTEELEKWFAKEIKGSLADNEPLSGTFTELKLQFDNLTVESTVPKEFIKFKFPVLLTDQVSLELANEFLVEIKFMQCTTDTEYCTEIHLMQHGFGDTEESTQIREIYLNFWKTKLETLREMVNGSWVIKDSELTLKCLQ